LSQLAADKTEDYELHMSAHLRRARIGIIGAAGLSAGKLLEILLRHPMAEIVTCVSESSPGTPVVEVHPHLRDRFALTFDEFDIDRLSDCDIVFSCKKAGDTFPFIREILNTGTRFVDLSGDYRLKRPGEYEKWYGLTHPHPDLCEEAVYGLSEWYRAQIADARLVANPGCYTTTAILACAPLVGAGLGCSRPIIVDAISGVSGAGRTGKVENLFISVAENVRAYRVASHQHTPEIEQELARVALLQEMGKRLGGKRPAVDSIGESIPVLFVPQVGPYKVGIMTRCYLDVAGSSVELNDELLHEILCNAYGEEPFIRISPRGCLPEIGHVAGTNYCDIAARFDPRTQTVVVISVTDNLVKGAAGQAVQNMNIMLGHEETTGLR
jgi:N-acetyl-gamma-glutamyl-phosphate reductase